MESLWSLAIESSDTGFYDYVTSYKESEILRRVRKASVQSNLFFIISVGHNETTLSWDILVASLWYLPSVSPCIVVNNSHVKQLPLVAVLSISLRVHTFSTRAQVGKRKKKQEMYF